MLGRATEGSLLAERNGSWKSEKCAGLVAPNPSGLSPGPEATASPTPGWVPGRH